ncbi:IQ motif and SEC7 domain-containing protein [Schistosoma japonicum]|uniref:IQ motif and SEC7 domain-containing protein n=2 Tax=Schistosoma japonicum TaxID=6182 RepID=A0A4Z2DJJ6_SCHJA|nr:IQ motif and SEC7 domain-containing protein [Schistosoma japonicum]
MTSESSRCDCILSFYSNNIMDPLNQYSTDYSCSVDRHTSDNSSNWIIDNPEKFLSWHHSRDYVESVPLRSEDDRNKSNSLHATCLSTEHIHQDLSDTGTCQKYIASTNLLNSFDSCAIADCVCSVATDQCQDSKITECNKCMKSQSYHHKHSYTSSGNIKSDVNSNTYPFVISNPCAIGDSCSLSDHNIRCDPNSSYADDCFDRMLPLQIELPSVCYDYGEDGSTKEIEEIESYYGGRLRAQRAARIIQNAYRDYRLRAEYARLRSEKGISRIIENNSSNLILGLSNNVDDLVIDRTYTDWSLEAAVSQIELQSSVPNGPLLTDDMHPKFHNNTSQYRTNSRAVNLPAVPPASNGLSSSNENPNVRKHNSGMCTMHSSRFSGPISSMNCNNLFHTPCEKLCSTSIKQLTLSNCPKAPFFSLPSHIVDPCSKIQTNNACEHCVSNHQANLARNIGGFSPNEIGSSMNEGLYFKKCCLPTSIPNPSSIQNNYFCIPAPSSAVQPQSTCNNSGYPVIPFPVGKVYKAPAVIPSCVPLSNDLLQLHSTQLVTNVPHVPVNQLESFHVKNNDSFQRQHSTHVPCRGQCCHLPCSCQLHLYHPYISHNTSRSSTYPTVTTPFPHRSFYISGLPNIQEKRRKRAYRIGLNIFNKYASFSFAAPTFLTKNGFLENSPQLIARFLLTRKGLSRVAIGEYLGNIKNEIAQLTTRQFIRQLNFQNKEVDEALRLLLGCFRTPGESQKIVHLLNEFQSAYVEQNASRVKSQFRNSDTVMILAYAIVMLHTDMYSPNVRPQSKMTREEFVRNLRGVDSGDDLDRDLLVGIYNRIKSQEMSVQPDHTDQVRKIQRHLTGPQKPLNLSIPQRRLVCYCRLYEVPDKNKRERSGAHQRELFLFNDLLLITKSVQKRRRDASVAYQVRMTIQLLGVKLVPFETEHHPNGLELLLPAKQMQTVDIHRDVPVNHPIVETPNGRVRILITLNTKTSSDRARLMEDLQECILEVTEMERLRREDVFRQNNQVHNCLGYKTRIDRPTESRHQMSLDQSSHTYSDHDITLSHMMCAPIACLMNSTEPKSSEQTKYVADSCHHYKLPDGQRLSGDSGLMADLEVPSS